MYFLFLTGVTTIQRGKNSLFQEWCWDNWISIFKCDVGLLAYTIGRNKLKWLKNLTIRAKILILLEENLRALRRTIKKVKDSVQSRRFTNHPSDKGLDKNINLKNPLQLNSKKTNQFKNAKGA